MTLVYAIIPARSGSKGVPDKNIRLLGKQPLISWSIAACRNAALIDRTFVSTDAASYAEIAVAAGAEVPFLRPAELSQDFSTDLDFILHAISWFEQNDRVPDFIAHVRPTTPFREASIVDKAIDQFACSSGFTALRSVHQMAESAYKCFEINGRGCLASLGSGSTRLDQQNAARQLFTSTYQANGYVDVLSVPHILANREIHGASVVPFITEDVVEVDTENDFERLEFQLSRNPQLITNLFG